ncbi:hypothetical protein [Streptomyces sp. NPDC048737]
MPWRATFARDIAPTAGLRHTRRDVLLRGVDIDALVGRTVVLDSGGGAVP